MGSPKVTLPHQSKACEETTGDGLTNTLDRQQMDSG